MKISLLFLTVGILLITFNPGDSIYCSAHHSKINSLVDLRKSDVPIQMDESTCGVAAAYYLAYLFDLGTDQNEIFQVILCIMNERNLILESGVALSAVSVTLSRLSLENQGYYLSETDLSTYLYTIKVPVLAHLSQPSNHYVVVIDQFEDYFLLADPSWGYRLVTTDEFYNMWSGVVLIPIPSEQQLQHSQDILENVRKSWQERLNALYNTAGQIVTTPWGIP
jgi:ABC-type bacteriocin/lantibiotic exporter with double-glycine peptidase domain